MKRPGARSALYALASVMLLLVLASPAWAQGLCSVTLEEADGNPSTEQLAVETPRTYTFEVTNTGSLDASASPTINNPPPGWFWSTQLGQVRVPSGQTTQLSIEVIYEGSSRVNANMSLRLTEVSCDTGGIGPGPTGPDTAPVSLALTHAALPAPPGADDGSALPWLVFGLIVLGTVVAIPAYYLRRRVAVDVLCEEPEGEVVAGRGTSYPITLRNRANKPVHLALEITDVAEGWSALVTLPELELAAKESRAIYMMVRAPAEAQPGDICVAELTVHPDGGRERSVSTLTRVASARKPSVPKERAAGEGEGKGTGRGTGKGKGKA